MRVVQANQAFSFNYTAFDQDPDLDVAFSVYNVSSGTPVFDQTIVAAYSNFGSYMADFDGVSGETYEIVGLVYTDNTFGAVDTSRSPSSEVVHVQGGNNSFFAFDYAAYDMDESLSIMATVYDMTTGTPVLDTEVVLLHAGNGVYVGSSFGILGHTYQAVSVVYTDGTFVTPDLDRSPGTADFDYLMAEFVAVDGAAYLIGYSPSQTNFSPLPFGRQPMIPPVHFTQGDRANLVLTAVDGNANPIDLTGATFESFIRSSNGNGVSSFPNGQHTINPNQVGFAGQFTLELDEDDTESCGTGQHKEILTQITIGGSSVYFRGFNILTVYPPSPFS